MLGFRAMVRLLWVFVLPLVVACPARQAPVPGPPASRPARLVVPPLDVLDVIGPDWPRVTPGVESRYFSSFDRAGGNADGFDGRYSTLYRLENGEHVIFDALGPGVLRTLWFTGAEEGGEGLDLGAIRFYFDDEARPRLETDQQRLFGGGQPPFVRPLVADNKVSTGGYVSWVPLAYRRRLVVTTEKRPSFYIAQYDTYPRGTAVASWTAETDLEAIRRRFAAALRGLTHRKLQRVPLDYRRRGRGTVEAVRFKPASTPTPGQLGRARVRIWWDGATEPAVDLPLGMFFGSGLGPAPVRAVAFTMQDGSYENRLPMPFWRGFRIRVDGLPGQLGLALGPARFPAGTAGQLHAIHRRENPTIEGRDFEWLDIKGAGKLVGTVLTIRPPTPETKRWWEGDLRSYADGRRTPGLHGTGHEDDHLGGWSNTFLSGPFSLPMHGEPASVLIERQGEQYNARTTLYRLWPGIQFMGSIRHSVEHGNLNRVQADYSGAAFFYLQPCGPRLEQSDLLDLGDAEAVRSHGYSVGGARRAELESAFEGREFREPVEDLVTYHRQPARFRLKVRPDNRGCLLRRLYDQQVPRQRAAVLVDGQPLGDWYVVEGNATLRWAERDLFLPGRFTRDKQAIQIEIRPLPGAPPWSAAEYRLLCVGSARGIQAKE